MDYNSNIFHLALGTIAIRLNMLLFFLTTSIYIMISKHVVSVEAVPGDDNYPATCPGAPTHGTLYGH